MENTEKKNNNPATGAALEEAVLKYLADNHPDDDKALDEMMQLLQGESDKLVEAVYKGLRYARDVDAASADGYLRGRNEAVEQKRNAQQERPKDDGGASRFQKVQLPVENADLFEASETVLVRGVGGYKPDGKTKSNQDLVLYVLRKSEDGASISAVTVNGQTIGEFENCIPTIPEGTMLVRMGRAASELDVQTPQFEALPQKSQNYCQIFKMQIEQSTLQKIANKEVGWTFSDQEEAAIYDMRLGMEKNFLFGVKSRVEDPGKHETIMLTGGIWDQAGGEFHYKKSSLTQKAMISMMRQAFTGNAGNKRKVLIGGSGLIELLNQMEQTKVVMAGENIVKWGIDFSEMHSKFGKLYILLSEVFDECGMEYNGMIIDPEYLQKYSHIPFTTEQLNLKQAGVRNTDALVLTEASCMTLRYPKAHLRIIGE